MIMVRLESASKTYLTRYGQVRALDKVNLHINEGEFVVVRGPSGSGKTTLLLSIGGMLRPTEGQVLIKNSDIYAMSKRQRAKFRAENIGFVFQLFHLVPYLNIIENVLLPVGVGRSQTDKEDAKKLLERLKLMERMFHKPAELSAGEKQRTAIARAMLKNPKIILADEPTGNLDPENSEDIIRHLAEFHSSGGTVIVVTHGKAVDQHAGRVVYLEKGNITDP
ncbi:MAG: ABC transporter ATP-binding protein [Candidatus Aminicenantes bacterium]|jgi:ABC-type lipoprotein export system ATPase subunit